MIATVVDTALEVSVVGSFTRIGPWGRSRLFGWARPPAAALAGRTVLVTGPTSGLGRAATVELASLGARLVLVGRSEARLRSLQDELAAAWGEDRFPTVVADMGSLESVRAAVQRILETEDRLDVVVDNAGAIYPTRTESPDGLEASMAVMTVGPFALVAGLLPLLERTPGSRVVAVTSGGMYTQALPLDDLQYRRGTYAGARAYARAKRAQVALVREWARRLGPRAPGGRIRPGGVAFAAMHPGWADTPGLAASLPAFRRVMGPLLRTPAEGIDTISFLAAHPDPAAISGGLFLDRRRRAFDRLPSTRLTPAERRELWDRIAAMAGVPDPSSDRRPSPGEARTAPASEER